MKSAIYIFQIIVLVFLQSCHREQAGHENHPVQGNIKRQDISRNTWTDFQNFSFEDKHTWGEIANYYGTKPVEFPAEYKNKYFGLSEETYERYSTKGDGNCWVRASLRVFFNNIFSSQELFDDLIKKIDEIEKRHVPEKIKHPIIDDEGLYVGTPWMKGFPWHTFKSGIKLLQSKAKDSHYHYLELLNYHNIDWFFIAAFRALMSEDEKYHADSFFSIGFDHQSSKFKSQEEIEKLWLDIIEFGNTGKDSNGTELSKLDCGENYIGIDGDLRRKVCTRDEVIEATVGLFNYETYLSASEWGDPSSTLHSRGLKKYFLTRRVTLNDVTTSVSEINEEYKCLVNNYHHIPKLPIFVDRFSEIIPVHINGNHYDVFLRKNNALVFDYAEFYNTINDPNARDIIKDCLSKFKTQ